MPPAIEPPNPGHALQLAKDCEYDATERCFIRRGIYRWLWPEGGRVWTATIQGQRTISKETYDILRNGEQVDKSISSFLFRSPAKSGKLYALVDDGFEAVAEPR